MIDETGLRQCQVAAMFGPTELLLHQPIALDGLGSGLHASVLLGAALGACAVMTIRPGAKRKGLAFAGCPGERA